jgi:hypothetical protein
VERTESKLISFSGCPAYLEAVDDCLLRPAFIVHGWFLLDGDEGSYPTGWWHWDSFIIESDRIDFFTEVTTSGAQTAESILLSEVDGDRLNGVRVSNRTDEDLPSSLEELHLAVLQTIVKHNPELDPIRNGDGPLIAPFNLQAYSESNPDFDPNHPEFTEKLEELGCYTPEELSPPAE